jgi:hypothetical protein
MKQFYLLTMILFFSYSNSIAQSTTVISQLNNPTGIFIDEDNMYICEFDGNKISKIDISNNNPTLQDVFTSISSCESLFVNGNDIYVARPAPGKISKIDISSNPPTVTDLVTGNLPVGLLLIGNDLYFSNYISNKISKIDISITNPPIIDVITGLSGPYDLQLNGNDLYISQIDGNKISKIDISSGNPTAIDFVNATSPHDIAFKDNILYFSSGNEISKIDLTLSVEQAILPENALQIYPNPSQSFLNISGLSKRESYTIYNNLGTVIDTGHIMSNENIDIKNLTSGVYFIKVSNRSTVKFIKK